LFRIKEEEEREKGRKKKRREQGGRRKGMNPTKSYTTAKVLTSTCVVVLQ
jgi:hypothetical protein